MRTDIRKDILDTAQQLFNEFGYNHVSTRDIAGKLDISKGNLTYYFKKKEEIIEAILSERPNTRISEAPRTLLELNSFFEDIQKTVKENAFYFWHHAQLAQLSSKIHEMQTKAFNENTLLLTQSFYALQNIDIMREEKYTGEYMRLSNTILLASIYWIPFSKLKNSIEDAFSNQAWSIIYPILTSNGVAELDTICNIF